MKHHNRDRQAHEDQDYIGNDEHGRPMYRLSRAESAAFWTTMVGLFFLALFLLSSLANFIFN